MKTRSVLIIAILFALIVGCATQTEEAPPTITVPGVSDSEILIGSTAALGGHASFLGTQTVHGSLAYINEINSKGGVHGRQIKLISYDDQYDPPKTVANTQKLISQDGVFALFDYVGTPTSVKIIDLVHQAQIPSIGFFTGAEALRNPLLDDLDISRAKKGLICVSGGETLALKDAEEAVMKIATEIDNAAEIIWGATIDPDLGNKIRVIVVLSDVHSPLTENEGLYYSKTDLEALLADLDSPFSIISSRNKEVDKQDTKLPSSRFSMEGDPEDLREMKSPKKKFLGLF